MYPEFKSLVLPAGKSVGTPILTVQGITNPYGVECVTLIWDYANFLFPSVSIKDTISIGNANTLLANANPKYFTAIRNNPTDPNQLPSEGDVLVFGGTPAAGYTMTFINPDGHTGVCQSATVSGYTLLQQNAPTGSGPNVVTYPWSLRPTLGWLHPANQQQQPAPVASTGQTVTLPKDAGTWAAYHVGSLLRKGTGDQVGTLLPGVYGPLVYNIISWVGNYAVNVKTEDFGEVTLWVRDTSAVIS
jgi:hypothetical protein